MTGVRGEINRLKQEYLVTTEKDKFRTAAARKQAEVKILSKLADLYAEIAHKDPLNNWTQLLKAHTLYNSCRVRSKTQAGYYARKAHDLEYLYRTRANLPANSQDATEHLKSLLSNIRLQTRDSMKPLRRAVAKSRGVGLAGINWKKISSVCNSMEYVVKFTNQSMIEFVQKIIKNGVSAMGGTPPCAFSAVAKGSLARGEATPYSDIEYFFIVERKDPDIKQYFRNLAMITYFAIGNLQETKLKYMNIKELQDWFDDQEISGVKIDGLQECAGNIPTGNGVTDKKSKYIYSIEELISKYTDIYLNPDEEVALQGDDSAMMSFTRDIYSYTTPGATNSLLSTFVAAKASITMNTERRAVSERMFVRDVEKYELNISDFMCESGIVEVKPKIYRLPSLIILDLSVLYEIQATSSWDALRQLEYQGKITTSMKEALHHLLAMASYIRMCTYLFHNSQKEAMILTHRRRGESGYFVSRRFFTATIIYMEAVKCVLPLQGLPTARATRHETEGMAIVEHLYLQ